MKTNNTHKQLSRRFSGFTLVELIVVITILIILGTVAFTSLTGHSGNARDSDRVTTLKNIENGLNIHQIKSSSYPTPENIIGTGTINGNILSSIGIIGDTISQIIKINKTPTDPLSKMNYVYGTNSDRTQYQIATVLENPITYNVSPFIQTVFATTSHQARVSGNYPGYLKYQSGTINPDTYIANIPSLLFNNTGSTNLFGTTTYFVVDKQQNLPYKIDDKTIIQNKNPNEIIQAITNTTTATLTGVNITAIIATDTSTGVSSLFTGSLLASFGGNISVIEAAVLGKTTNVASVASTGQTAPIASAASNITATGITWNWQSSTSATSYQFSTDNNTWSDKGNVTSFNETGLVCATSYTRYVKACSSGGCSTATTLSSANTSSCSRIYATWNPNDKNAGIVLSNGNLTATCPSGANTVRATMGKSSGKWYWEYLQNTTSVEPGIANSAASLGNYLGGTANGWMYYNLGTKYTNYIATTYGASYVSADVLGVALDMDNGTVSFLKNNIFQGVAYTGLTGAIYPATGSDGGGGVSATANFGATPLTYAPPNGTFWNPTDKGIGITTSNNNLTTTDSTTLALIRTNTSKSIGKWYWEVTINTAGLCPGVANASASAGSWNGSSANSWGWYGGDGKIYHSGVVSSNNQAFSAGDVLGFALNVDVGTLSMYKNGVLQNNSFTGLSGALFISSGNNVHGAGTLNTGVTPFSYTPPSGYSAWDTTTYNIGMYQ